MLLRLGCPGVSVIICRRLSFWQNVPLAFLSWFQLLHLDFFSSIASLPVPVSSSCRSPGECFPRITWSLFVVIFKINITGLWRFEGILLLGYFFGWLAGFVCLFWCREGGGRWRASHGLPREVVLLMALWTSFLSGSCSWLNLCLFWDEVNNKVPLFLNQKMSCNFKYVFWEGSENGICYPYASYSPNPVPQSPPPSFQNRATRSHYRGAREEHQDTCYQLLTDCWAAPGHLEIFP